MLNHDKQQQSVILKGIAQQILTMQVPTVEEVNKLLLGFSLHLETSKQQLEHEIFDDMAKHDNVFYCYAFEAPNGEVVYHVEHISWEARGNGKISKIAAMHYASMPRFKVWDEKIAKLWPGIDFDKAVTGD